jgi:hypothetical protein
MIIAKKKEAVLNTVLMRYNWRIFHVIRYISVLMMFIIETRIKVYMRGDCFICSFVEGFSFSNLLILDSTIKVNC